MKTKVKQINKRLVDIRYQGNQLESARNDIEELTFRSQSIVIIINFLIHNSLS